MHVTPMLHESLNESVDLLLRDQRLTELEDV